MKKNIWLIGLFCGVIFCCYIILRLRTEARLNDASAVLKKMQRSLVFSNRSDYVSCFYGDDKCMALVNKSFDLDQAVYAFDDALTNKFGPLAVEEYYEYQSTNDQLPSFTFNGVPRDIDWASSVVLTSELDKFSFLNPQTGFVNYIILVNGGWKIDCKSLLPPGADPTALVKFSDDAVQFLDVAKSNVMLPQMSIGDLKDRMAKVWLSAHPEMRPE